MQSTDKTLLDYFIDRELCKQSYFEFVKEAWKIIEPSTELVLNWHIEKIANELQEVIERNERGEDAENIVINVPPGTTKSTLITKLLTPWVWTRAASKKVIIATYEHTLATNHALKARDVIRSNWYQGCWGSLYRLKSDKNVKTEYENTRSGTVITTSTGSSVIGKHGDIIIIDDPNNPQTVPSQNELQEVNRWHDLILSTRMTNKRTTVKILVMQRIAVNDLTDHVLNKHGEKWRHICLPGEITAKNTVKPAEWERFYVNSLLDVNRLDRISLDRLQANLGTQGYNTQVQQKPAAPEGNIIKREWFTTELLNNFNSYHTTEPIVFFMDTAYKDIKRNEKGKEPDPTGIIATCKINHTLYIIHGTKARLQFPDLVRFVPAYVKQHGYSGSSTIRIEPKASGISLVQTLREISSLNVVETPSPHDDKTTRLTAASPSVEVGKVVLIEGVWVNDFVDEVCDFPNAAHDEYVDLLSYAVAYHLKGDKVNLSTLASALH